MSINPVDGPDGTSAAARRSRPAAALSRARLPDSI
jgi:hypothetical protein